MGPHPGVGFADVVASDVVGIKVGERFYGYFPIASHLWMRPGRVTERGFYDSAEHRQALASAYNQYTRCSWDSYYTPGTENLQILLKPLFLTSWMLADFLQDKAFSVQPGWCSPVHRAKPLLAPQCAWKTVPAWNG